jgi:hypothetical protein
MEYDLLFKNVTDGIRCIGTTIKKAKSKEKFTYSRLRSACV